MKHRFKRIFRLLGEPVSMSWLIKISQQKVLLPFYHTVSDIRLPHISNLYSLRNTELFVRDLEFFCKYFNPVSIEDLHEIIYLNKKKTKPVFHLSFDDGLRELFSIVAPILEKKGIPATIFVNTDFIDNKDIFYRYKVSLLIEKINAPDGKECLKDLTDVTGLVFKEEGQVRAFLMQLNHRQENIIDEIAKVLNVDFSEYLKSAMPYLHSGEISDLLTRGFNIGSHSLNHPYFKSIDFEEQKIQVTESFKILCESFGIKKKYFAFPFNDENVDAEFFNWLYNVEKCRLSFGTSGLKNDVSRFHLHRIPIEGYSEHSSEIVKSEYIYYLLKALVNKNTIRIR